MTAALCNPLDFENLSEWALGVLWKVDPADEPTRDQYNTVFFPKQRWAVTCYWDNDVLIKNSIYSYSCDTTTIHDGEEI